MSRIKTLAPGVAVSALIAVVCWFLGQAVPLVGGAVFAILLGMVIGTFWKEKGAARPGIKFASKKILQTAVVLLGFGLPLTQLAQVGVMSLPVILSTISASLITAAVLCRVMHVPGRTATLIGVGSSICGGSAIAATLGDVIGLSNNGFGLFAGTAVNDTSSVTAAAAVWDGMHPGANALDYATIVKLTRTLAIIPITFALALWVSARERKQAAQNGADMASTSGFSLKRALPTFIALFVCASLVATGASAAGVDPAVFAPLKTLSKFFIVVAMAAIGLNTDVVGLVKSGAKPIVLGAACWVAIACTSLAAQHALGLW